MKLDSSFSEMKQRSDRDLNIYLKKNAGFALLGEYEISSFERESAIEIYCAKWPRELTHPYHNSPKRDGEFIRNSTWEDLEKTAAMKDNKLWGVTRDGKTLLRLNSRLDMASSAQCCWRRWWENWNRSASSASHSKIKERGWKIRSELCDGFYRAPWHLVLDAVRDKRDDGTYGAHNIHKRRKETST